MGENLKASQLKRLARVAKIQQLLVSGLSVGDIAQRLEVSTKTVQRDIAWQYEELNANAAKDVAAYRSALMAELGRTYDEAVQDCTQSRDQDGQSAGEFQQSAYGTTDKYLTVRIRALTLMSKLTGAEVPNRLILMGKIDPNAPSGEVMVDRIPEEQAMQFATDIREMEASIVAMPKLLNGNGNHQ